MHALDFSRRSSEPELMDDADVAPRELERCLRDLSRLNRLTFGYRPTLGFLEELRRKGLLPARPLRIVDVGCGYGDTLREVGRWALRAGVGVELTGVDVNPVTTQIARRATKDDFGISWVTANALSYQPKNGVDVVLSSLFTHHLADEHVTRFVRWMDDTAELGWFINDLHRHPLPYHSFGLLARIQRWHRFILHDGPVSIARAFDHDDWRRLLWAAQVEPRAARIEWWAPFRLCVGLTRSRK